jgi:circadian clock protein KaiC
VAPPVFGEQSAVFVQEHIRNLILDIEDNLQCTTLVTSDILTGNPGLSRYSVEEFVVEGVIVLEMAKQLGRRVRTLSVRKMRSTDADIQDHAFQIITQRGIVLGK